MSEEMTKEEVKDQIKHLESLLPHITDRNEENGTLECIHRLEAKLEKMSEANYGDFVADVEETVEKSWHVEEKIQEWIDGNGSLDSLAEKHNVTREGMEEYMNQEYY